MSNKLRKSVIPIGDIISSFVNDDLGLANHFFSGVPTVSYSLNGQFVNTDDYDIVPKKSKIEKDLKAAEQRLQELKDRRANQIRWFDEREKQLNDEIYELRKQLSP